MTTSTRADRGATLDDLDETLRSLLTTRFALDLSPERVAGLAGLDAESVAASFPDSDALLGALVLRAYHDMSDAAEAAAAASSHLAPAQRWSAICLGVREWALARPADYSLIWGPPVPGFVAPEETMAAGARTVVALTTVLRDAVADGTLADRTVQVEESAELGGTIDTLSAGLLSGLPRDVVIGMVVAWTQLHGMLGFEVHGHVAGIAEDPGAFFVHATRWTARSLGLPDS